MIKMHPKDSENYYKWLEKHSKEADLLEFSTEHRYCTAAIYKCPEVQQIESSIEFFKAIREINEN